jgi:hypothetical protein
MLEKAKGVAIGGKNITKSKRRNQFVVIKLFQRPANDRDNCCHDQRPQVIHTAILLLQYLAHMGSTNTARDPASAEIDPEKCPFR